MIHGVDGFLAAKSSAGTEPASETHQQQAAHTITYTIHIHFGFKSLLQMLQ